ncbi:uncharacterized protein LOC18101294 isoform X3 [Populus trichocarpa]|uniref:uncharacterized protein LOC18101294 isoform X3 n=1 Tax=Populus trichocarpa TaxID=3694 RepID=UPI002279BC70|nr:uncharacterized protein LOC18101294 isoform X3 [Populus trichocarpa]XP_052310908.1 uncharacterized protein LOC18101294 isoform X3 [Populus trichocarpa]XP_052310909.1 uncharacterized protein LOC18101294 isoform X3 [Populus trichocarpa]
MNPYGGSGQRMRGNAGAMSNSYGGGGRQDGYSSVEAEQHPGYKSSIAEGQWQWDRDSQNVHNQLPTHTFSEGQVGSGARSYYHGQPPDPKMGLESQSNKEAGGTQPHDQDMELGFEDKSLPMSFEGLERKFFDEVTKLAKEQGDAEVAENARHREKIIEINTRYQEKLSALRAQQTNRREEFLRKESQARLSQYQQASRSHYPNTGLQDARGYSGAAATGPISAGETHRAYASSQFESYRGRPQYGGGGRAQGNEGRIPYPEGRVYNNAGARHY